MLKGILNFTFWFVVLFVIFSLMLTPQGWAILLSMALFMLLMLPIMAMMVLAVGIAEARRE